MKPGVSRSTNAHAARSAKRLAGAVRDGPRGRRHRLLVRRRVPVRLGVCVARARGPGVVGEGGDGGERRRDDDAADLRGCVRGDGLEDAGRALDGRGQQVALVVLDAQDEGRGAVDHAGDVPDGGVEGARHGDVGDLDGGEGRARRGECLEHLLAGAGVADLAADVVAVLEECLDHMGAHERSRSCDQDGALVLIHFFGALNIGRKDDRLRGSTEMPKKGSEIQDIKEMSLVSLS